MEIIDQKLRNIETLSELQKDQKIPTLEECLDFIDKMY